MKMRRVFYAQWPGDSTVWMGDCSRWADSLRRAGCKVTTVRALAMKMHCPTCEQGFQHH